MSRLSRMTTLLIALVIGTAGLVAGCAGPQAPNPSPTVVPGTQSSLESLTIGVAFDTPGLGLKSGDKFSGFDVETAKYVAKALGVPEDKITWREAVGSNREKFLEDGQVDLVVSTYSITDERRQVVDFAGPYFVAHQDILVRRNDTDITGPETLTKRTVCTIANSTSGANIEAAYGGSLQLTTFPTISECVKALAAGQVDAATTDDVVLAGFAAQPEYRGKLKVVGKGFSDEIYGIGVSKKNPELRHRVNLALEQYIADGSWKKALEITVKPSGYKIPDPPTVDTN